jgi:hypothetical protein
MKYCFTFLFFAFLFIIGFRCEKENAVRFTNCFKGRLESKGICMNYTISVVEGNMDPSKVEASWTNPQTGKVYKNAFRLASVCTFPPGIQEGDEFYFTLPAEGVPQDCVVCMAYYPTPKKELAITVINKPCQ